ANSRARGHVAGESGASARPRPKLAAALGDSRRAAADRGDRPRLRLQRLGRSHRAQRRPASRARAGAGRDGKNLGHARGARWTRRPGRRSLPGQHGGVPQVPRAGCCQYRARHEGGAAAARVRPFPTTLVDVGTAIAASPCPLVHLGGDMQKLQQWRRKQEGKLGYILLWALGVPIPVLFAIFLLRGCNLAPSGSSFYTPEANSMSKFFIVLGIALASALGIAGCGSRGETVGTAGGAVL